MAKISRRHGDVCLTEAVPGHQGMPLPAAGPPAWCGTGFGGGVASCWIVFTVAWPAGPKRRPEKFNDKCLP